MDKEMFSIWKKLQSFESWSLSLQRPMSWITIQQPSQLSLFKAIYYADNIYYLKWFATLFIDISEWYSAFFEQALLCMRPGLRTKHNDSNIYNFCIGNIVWSWQKKRQEESSGSLTRWLAFCSKGRRFSPDRWLCLLVGDSLHAPTQYLLGTR